MDLLSIVAVLVCVSVGAEVDECQSPGDKDCEVIAEEQDYPYPELTNVECGKKSITACCKHDGFGAQYQAMMNIYMYARFNNQMQYCISEWWHMTHGQDPKDMFQWVGGHLYGPRKTDDTYKQPLRAIWWPVEVRNQAGKDEIRGFYFSQPKPKILLDEPKHFAIHIRRGDVIELYRRYQVTYITDEQNIKAIMKIRELYKEEFTRIHILSDAKKEDLETFLSNLTAEGIEYKLHLKADVDIKEAFHHMVMADVLIYGPSEFCRSAAFLNGGSLVYSVQDLLDGSDEPTHLFQILPGTKVTDNGYFAG